MKSAASAAGVILGAACLVLASTVPAFAYTGPGAGITAIGSLLALVAALALCIVGFVWYPVKRLLKRAKKPSADKAGDKAAQPTS